MSAPDWADDIDDLIADLAHHLGDLPYHATPERLYRADDLYADLAANGFEGCVDQRIYARAAKAGGERIGPVESLAQRLHDHGITVALDRFRDGRRLVGVMGGHAMVRGSERYRSVVSLGRALARSGACVVTGGGPGAMEAANLGAATSELDENEVRGFVDELAAAPDVADDPTDFVAAALAVLDRIPDPAVNLSLPTWFYGHEPTNPFATHIAKYFSNSEREDGLLAIATGGIVFVPGGPGTIQEVFQDAAQNAYETFGPPSPMVFLEPTDAEWWTASGVLDALGRSFTRDDGTARPGRDRIHHVTSVDAVITALTLP